MRALLLLTIAACGVVREPPRDDGSTPPGGVVEIVPPDHADEAIAIIEGVYRDDTGVEIAPVVHWTDTLIPCGAVLCGGLSYGCADVWVADRLGTLGIPMALAHELGHCARGTLTGDSDGGHLDGTWWSDTGLVEQAHAAVRRAGF